MVEIVRMKTVAAVKCNLRRIEFEVAVLSECELWMESMLMSCIIYVYILSSYLHLMLFLNLNLLIVSSQSALMSINEGILSRSFGTLAINGYIVMRSDVYPLALSTSFLG